MNNNNNAEYVPLLCKSRYVSPFVLKRENKRLIEVVENKNAQVTPHVYERGNHPPTPPPTSTQQQTRRKYTGCTIKRCQRTNNLDVHGFSFSSASASLASGDAQFG